MGIHDNGFTLRGNSRLYFASSCEDGWNPNMYAQMGLNGKRFAYTLDMSNVGCHCNAAAYFVDMPGNNGGENGDYYCDANHGGGIWCPEDDVMEGNKHTMACTLHTCNGGGGNWDYCDGGGCQANAFNVNSGMMCPGGAPSTLTKVLLFHTSRPIVWPTHGWDRELNQLISTCAMMEAMLATWLAPMTAWFSQHPSGEVVEL